MALSASEIRKQVREKKYKNLDYKGIDSKKEQISSHWDNETKNAVKNPEKYQIYKRNEDAKKQYEDAKNSTSINDDTKDFYYDQYKDTLKAVENDKRKDYFKSWLSYQGARIAKDGEDSAERQYESAKSNYKSAKNELDNLKEDKYYTEQAENQEILKNNNDVAKLVKEAYETQAKKDAELDPTNMINSGGMVKLGTGTDVSRFNEAYQKLIDIGYSQEKANSLIDTYSRQVNAKDTEELKAKSSEFADKHPVLSRAAYVAAQTGNVAAVPDMLKNGVENAISGDYKPLDVNSPAYSFTNFRNAVSEKNTENLYNYALNKTGSKKVANVVTLLDSTGLSLADMLSVSYLPEPVALAIMSCDSAAMTAVDATNRGLSADKAVSTAIAAGAAEAVFEKISLGNFKAFQASGRRGVLNAVKDILKQTFTEGSEEAFTDVANAITDQIINGDNSAIMQEYQSYINSGLNEREAQKKTATSFGKQVGEDFIGGAIAGGVAGGVGVTARKGIYNQSNYKNIGESIKNGESNAGDAQAVINNGLASQDKNSRAYKIASKLDKGNITNDVDVLTGASIKDAEYDYKKTSSSKLGELAIENNRQIIRENLTSAVSKDENGEKISKVFKKLTTASNMTKADAKAIRESDVAVSALNAELGTDFTGADITKDVLGDIATGLAYGETDFSYIKTKPQKAENATDLTGRASNVSTVRKSQIKINVTSDQVPTETYNIPVTAVATGKTAYISSTKPVTIRGNEVTLNTPIGEVNYSDVNIPDNDTRVILDYVAENDKIGDTGANTIYRNFNKRVPNATAEQYVQQADLIYQAGLANDTDFNTYINSHPQFRNSALVLGEGAENIYRSAQTDRQAFDKAQQALKEAKTQKQSSRKGTGIYKNETATDSDIEEVLKTLADVTGYDYKTTSDTKSNGHIIHNLAETYISNETGKEYQTSIHENVHYVKEHNAEDYENLRNAVLGWYKENKGNKKFNDIKKKYADVYIDKDNPMTSADIEEELVADGIAAIFTTDEGVEQFAEYVAKKSEPENKSIVKAFKKLVAHIVDTIKKALSRGNLTQYQKEYLEMEKDQAEHIRTLFLDSLDKASENYKSEQKNNTVNNGDENENTKNMVEEGNTVKYSAINFVEDNNRLVTREVKYIIQQVKDKIDIVPKHEIFNVNYDDISTYKHKSDYVLNIFNAQGNIAENKEIGAVELIKKGAKSTMLHGYGKLKIATVKAIKPVIENGKVIAHIKNYNKANVDNNETQIDRYIIAGLGKINDDTVVLGVMVESYPTQRYNKKFYLHEAITIKADSPITTVSQSEKTVGKSASNNSISNSNKNVKNSFTVDSDGNTLSEQQQEYFKDSKVRDKDGKLLVVYHGTPNANFTKFRSGSYFTQNEEYAERYQSPGASSLSVKINSDNPDTYKVYLNIKKPFDTRNKVEREIFENEFYMKWGNGSPLSERGLPDWVEAMDLQEFIEENEYDYDGLIVDEGGEGGYGMPVYDRGLAYVTFSSNQIKNVDNINPTDNDDIRFSKDVDNINDLKRENKKLKEANELLRHEFELTGGLETSISSATNIGIHINKTYNTSISGAEIGRDIKAMCDRVMQDEYRSYDTLYNEAKAIAKKIVDNKKKEISPEIQAVVDDIRSTAVKLSESQKKEVAYYYGSYGNFRRSNLKNINISNDGIPLDIRYQELKETYPGLFTEAAEPDEPIAIVEIVDTLINSVENDYGYDADELTDLVTNDIIEAYFNVGTHKTFADKKQREINLIRSQYSNQIQKIKEQKKKDYQKALKDVADLKGQVRNLKQEHSRALIEMRKAEREKIRDTRERAETRLRIQRTLLKISTLTKQTKKQHIPNNMIDAVKELINAITFDTKTDVILSERIRNLDDSFRMLDSKENSQYAYITDLYDQYIKEELDNLRMSIQGKPIRDLSLPELKSVEKLIKMTLGSINHMNNMYGYERNKSIEGSANTVKEQISSLNRDKAELGIVDSLKYGTMKPEYFFEYLGSDELLERYKEVRKGEDTWAVTISDAKKRANDIRKQYGWKDWDYKSKIEYKTMYNETLNLNLGQMMGIYAMSLREQTRNHLLKGGFQFTKAKPTAKEYIKNKGKKILDSRQHHLTIFDISSISNLLTLEQREYVQDMIEYLSTEMAEKGNEVSRQLYDVELFKEPVYYPAHCAKDFMHKSSTDTIGSRKIINSGMTNATLENAKNPLVLEEFDDVWAGHVDEMAKYNAFAIPLENFDRVFNYQSHDSNEYSSVRAVINDTFGSKATNYINDLLEDLNGGVVRESGSDIADKLTSLFKKNAVFASASVVIQQPSAIGRALCMIDSKYFAKTTITKRDYEELKKYAPVAIIKEMGYFDTNMAQSTVDYLNNPEYTGAKEKATAFFTDRAYRDEKLSYGASKADELTWCHIWNACKAEAFEKYSNLTKEEQLQKAGEKFTDVITKTQVYDSVFSRSALMRSKNGVVKMATAFMAEPTTSLNMFVNSLIQAKRGKISKAQAGKVFGSLMAASILNTLLQSLVTAGRDDDDDEKYGEKYIAQLLPNFIDNANPLNQISFVKDIISIFKGYDVSRADMNVIDNLENALDKMSSDSLSIEKKIENLAGAIGALFGLPVKNVMRDMRSAWNIGSSFFNGRHFNETALQENFKGELKDAIVSDDILAFFGLDILPEKDKSQLIYEAIKNGDDEMYSRIADNVSNPDKYIKEGLIENDSRIAEAGTEYSKGEITALVNTSKELESEGFDYDLVVKTIKSYANKLNETEESSKKSKLYNADDLYNAVNSGDQSTIDEVISSNKKIDMENGKTEEEAEKSIKSSLTTKFKEEYLEANDNQKAQIQNMLNKTGLFTDDEYLKWKSSAYNTDTMIKAFESNDTKQIQEYVSGRINAKIEAGMTKDNAVSGIKTSITNQYKEEFINGNADTRANIITIMTKTGLYGSRTDVIAWINKYWMK